MPGTPFSIIRQIFIGILFAMVLCSGCSVSAIRSQSKQIEETGELRGTVKRDIDRKGPIVVMRFRESNGSFLLVGVTQANELTSYSFSVAPGMYYIAAFIDSNSDGLYQAGEPMNYHGKPSGVIVEAGATVTVSPITISEELPALPQGAKIEKHLPLAMANMGKVIRLDDQIFTTDNYSMGMWRPVDFLGQIGGGLMFLQPYEKNTIPVIFVHGINGGPTDLAGLISRLDRKRFQPWILYYPSGVRLGLISDYLVRAVATMQSRHGFQRFAVVSHSMGGLVTRSFVKKYVEQYPDRTNNLAMVMTINSPMGGMPSAAIGLKAPFMVQSWRDVAPGSTFLEDIHGWSWPSAIPYYLIFSNAEGKDGDGVVAMKNQILLKLQKEAVRMYGFNNTHVGTLSDENFLGVFDMITGTIK